mmetsp:Transcript_6559/g.16302  ORF Transcript_6559/g.16302 Transcript_6559/m.16302 type:complete len:272 (+) Transcript_6559:865-1680(+)
MATAAGSDAAEWESSFSLAKRSPVLAFFRAPPSRTSTLPLTDRGLPRVQRVDYEYTFLYVHSTPQTHTTTHTRAPSRTRSHALQLPSSHAASSAARYSSPWLGGMSGNVRDARYAGSSLPSGRTNTKTICLSTTRRLNPAFLYNAINFWEERIWTSSGSTEVSPWLYAPPCPLSCSFVQRINSVIQSTPTAAADTADAATGEGTVADFPSSFLLFAAGPLSSSIPAPSLSEAWRVVSSSSSPCSMPRACIILKNASSQCALHSTSAGALAE